MQCEMQSDAEKECVRERERSERVVVVVMRQVDGVPKWWEDVVVYIAK